MHYYVKYRIGNKEKIEVVYRNNIVLYLLFLLNDKTDFYDIYDIYEKEVYFFIFLIDIIITDNCDVRANTVQKFDSQLFNLFFAD